MENQTPSILQYSKLSAALRYHRLCEWNSAGLLKIHVAVLDKRSGTHWCHRRFRRVNMTLYMCIQCIWFLSYTLHVNMTCWAFPRIEWCRSTPFWELKWRCTGAIKECTGSIPDHLVFPSESWQVQLWLEFTRHVGQILAIRSPRERTILSCSHNQKNKNKNS